jgi:hypothetical protein
MKFERMLDISYTAAFSVTYAGIALLILSVSTGLYSPSGRMLSVIGLLICLFGLGGVFVTRLTDERE